MRDVEIKTSKDITNDAEEGRVYEFGYLILPTIAEEEVPAQFGNLKERILSMKGDVISNDMPRMITLAYPMQKILSNVRNKFTTAYFGWIKFTMEPAQVLELKKALDLDRNLIRFLILKTVKENTIAAKRFIRGEGEYRRPMVKKTENEEAVPINKEEVDKEIDALVAN